LGHPPFFYFYLEKEKVMVSISDLLKYKDEVKIVHPNDPKKVIWKGWVKILGDESIKEAYKFARIASSNKRAALKDMNSVDYQDEINSIGELDDEMLHNIIRASKENDYTRESVAIVSRQELPKIEEIADEPDAPSLEDQEKLDAAEEKVQDEFLKAVSEYVEQRKIELETDLQNKSREEIVKMAQEESAKIIPMQYFLQELDDQKGYRGTYVDKECKVKAFKSVEEFKDTHTAIKAQILAAYKRLEIEPDEVKN
jgi:3-oxoacyl-ACP reductase-like protein